MVEANADAGVTVLDIGGGIGVIELELLRSKASSAGLVEASPPYIRAAREEAQAAGVVDRLKIEAGDFVRHADTIEAADIVTLDKVICCYPEVGARRLYALVLPRDRWHVRMATRLENVWRWLKREAYAHANDSFDHQLGSSDIWQPRLSQPPSPPLAPPGLRPLFPCHLLRC